MSIFFPALTPCLVDTTTLSVDTTIMIPKDAFNIGEQFMVIFLTYRWVTIAIV